MKKKILIVDDDPGIQTMLKLMLQLEGFDSIVAEIRKNLRLGKVRVSDLVLLDAMMPNGWIDGIETDQG